MKLEYLQVKGGGHLTDNELTVLSVNAKYHRFYVFVRSKNMNLQITLQ